jgi:hypothetical protein
MVSEDCVFDRREWPYLSWLDLSVDVYYFDREVLRQGFEPWSSAFFTVADMSASEYERPT